MSRRVLRGMPTVLSNSTVAVLACFGLAGCDVGYQPVLSDYAVTPLYSPALLSQVVLNHDLKVEVYGNQFGVAPVAFGGHVVAEMNLSGFESGNFTTYATPKEVSPYRVVWNFRPPPKSISPNAVCNTHSTAASDTEGGYPIDVYAAFCRGDEALTSVRGELYYTKNDTSIEFVDLVDKMTLSLFPMAPLASDRRSGALALAPPPPKYGGSIARLGM